MKTLFMALSLLVSGLLIAQNSIVNLEQSFPEKANGYAVKDKNGNQIVGCVPSNNGDPFFNGDNTNFWQRSNLV